MNSHLDTIHTLHQLAYILNSQWHDYMGYLKWQLPEVKHVTCRFELMSSIINFAYKF